eukprot:15006778-Alexandrium_andersonii.AAC.1
MKVRRARPGSGNVGYRIRGRIRRIRPRIPPNPTSVQKSHKAVLTNTSVLIKGSALSKHDWCVQ